MKLVVLSKMTSTYKLSDVLLNNESIDEWKTHEFEFEKVGFLKKPEFNVRNLSIQVIKRDKNYIVCRTSDGLCIDLEEQKNIIETSDEKAEWREMIKQKLDFMKLKGKFTDVRLKGCIFSEFPVTMSPVALVTLSDDVSYHYLFSIVE